MTLTKKEALELLTAPRSRDRRRGAVRLRRLADSATGRDVRRALEGELSNDVTWETQYHLAVALGLTGDSGDVSWLKQMALRSRSATMVNCGLGDAIVRLGREHFDDGAPVIWCQSQGVDLLDEGAQRAVALLRMHPPPEVTALMIASATQKLTDEDHPFDTLGVWVLIAAAGWSGPAIKPFLERFADDQRDDVAASARDALAGAYRRLPYL